PGRRSGPTLAGVIVVGRGLNGLLGRLVIATVAGGPSVVPTSLGPAPVDPTIQQARHHRTAAVVVGRGLGRPHDLTSRSRARPPGASTRRASLLRPRPPLRLSPGKFPLGCPDLVAAHLVGW